MNLVNVHLRETRDRIIKLAKMLEECVPHMPPDILSKDIDTSLALRISELSKDYVMLKEPAIRNAEMREFFTYLPNASSNYINYASVAEFFQMLGCIADIRTNVAIVGDLKYKMHLTHLERSIKFIQDRFNWFLMRSSLESIETEENAEYLETEIITAGLKDICEPISKFMKDLFEDIEVCEKDDTKGDRKYDIKALGASCAMYMKEIGCTLVSRNWIPGNADQHKLVRYIGTWEHWGSTSDGIFYKPDIYLAWYNPISKKVLETVIKY